MMTGYESSGWTAVRTSRHKIWARNIPGRETAGTPLLGCPVADKHNKYGWVQGAVAPVVYVRVGFVLAWAVHHRYA